MIYTNFKLPTMDKGGINIELSENLTPSFNNFLNLIKIRRRISALLVANPSTSMLFFLFLLRLIRATPYQIFIFDLILKFPASVRERVIAKIKGLFIRSIDFIIVIHRDTSGYELYYGLKNEQFLYVPFKANNFDHQNQPRLTDGEYVVALGASQRDYRVLIEAAKWIDDKIIIVCSDNNSKKHNADIGDSSTYPTNLVRIREDVDSLTWYKYLAGSKFVVIPIKGEAIQPAGISVYLEAMLLQKAVIITEGASSNFILENDINALVVPPSDPESLAAAVNRLSKDLDLRTSVAMAGYAYALSLGNDGNLRERVLSTILKKLDQS